MDGLNAFEVLACQRWSFRRIWLLAKLWAHCALNLHRPVTIWGDYAGLLKPDEIRPNSWAVTYSCMQCQWTQPKGQ